MPTSNFGRVAAPGQYNQAPLFGDMDKCFDWLEKAVEEHDSLIIPYYSFHFFGPLRTHPRFQALLRRMNLDP